MTLPASWICRFGISVEPIDPNVAVPNVAAGLLKLGVLKMLNPSSRSCTFACSPASGKFLNRERPVVTSPGPTRVLRPALP